MLRALCVFLVVVSLSMGWNLLWRTVVSQRDVSQGVAADHLSPTATGGSWFAVTPENDARAIAARVEREERESHAPALRDRPQPPTTEPSGQREGQRARAERLSESRVSRSSNSGRTLHSANRTRWLAASSQDRLATAEDFVARFWRTDGYRPELIDQMRRQGGLRAAAQQQVACIGRMLESLESDATVAIAAAVCYQTN